MPISKNEVQAPVIFLLAHHDDELFIATLLKRLSARHKEIACAWLTRGGLKGREREAESIRAMELLGIDSSRLYFFRLPDRSAFDYIEEVSLRLKRLLARLHIASVFVPAFEGGHPDHDAAQLAAALALAQMDREISLYEFPLYNRYKTRLLRVGEFIPDNAAPIRWTPMKLEDRLLKRKLAYIYTSQRLISLPLLGLKGGPMMLHVNGEPFRRVPDDRDYSRRPHSGRLAYEYYTLSRFRDFAGRAKMSGRAPN
jgi:LmbE family N-acetylglucosaminyl deacetylase